MMEDSAHAVASQVVENQKRQPTYPKGKPDFMNKKSTRGTGKPQALNDPEIKLNFKLQELQDISAQQLY